MNPDIIREYEANGAPIHHSMQWGEFNSPRTFIATYIESHGALPDWRTVYNMTFGTPSYIKRLLAEFGSTDAILATK